VRQLTPVDGCGALAELRLGRATEAPLDREVSTKVAQLKGGCSIRWKLLGLVDNEARPGGRVGAAEEGKILERPHLHRRGDKRPHQLRLILPLLDQVRRAEDERRRRRRREAEGRTIDGCS
jgi:hypothetical protein